MGHLGRCVACGRRLRVVRRAARPDRRAVRAGQHGSGDGVEQLRHRRRRIGGAAGRRTDQADHQFLRGGEQGVRPAVPARRAGAGADPAGHTGRAAARRGVGDPGVLHARGGRHDGRRGRPAMALPPGRVGGRRIPGEGGARVRRPAVRAGTRHCHRLRARARVIRGSARQPGVQRSRRATSTRCARWPAGSPSPRWSTSSSRARSAPTTCTPRVFRAPRSGGRRRAQADREAHTDPVRRRRR